MAALESLLTELANAKASEAKAKAHRVACEQRVVGEIEDAPESGSRTMSDGTLRCTIKFGLTYKADVLSIGELNIPDALIPLRAKPPSYEFDRVRYEALRESHPDVFAVVAAFVATKPSKPALTLKL